MIKLFNLVFYYAKVGKEFWRMGRTQLKVVRVVKSR
jgi:hypothetical protein